MKKLLLSVLLIIISLCSYGQYNYLGTYTSNGTPNYLETVGDNITTATLETISNSLPESYPVPDFNPHYITSGYETNLVLDEQADVYVTFISEGAGYRNVLGFYTYDPNNPSSTAPTASEITIIFPNVSALGSGGGLVAGDKVNIGSFAAGTGIGWVLFANGWNGSQVTTGYWQLYSDVNYNPEQDADLKKHNVLLLDPENERIILGFEDIRRDHYYCDNDFNDAIFTVTATPFSALSTDNYADADSSTDVTSSYYGGLESNGSLARAIAARNFSRVLNGTGTNLKTLKNKFNSNVRLSKGTSSNLAKYFPTTGMFGMENAHIASPKDLPNITNADEVFSVDYYKGDIRISAALGTVTKGRVYDHSKVICDRLNSSSLEDVRSIKINGHEMIFTKIIREDNTKEYSIGFSIKLGGTENELFSLWNAEDYPEGDYYNFQVWGSSVSQIVHIIKNIVVTFSAEKSLISENLENRYPTVFVKTGYYKNGKLHLNIANKEGDKTLSYEASIAPTEVTQNRISINGQLNLTGKWNQSLVLDSGYLFDIGISFKTEKSNAFDVLYLADGPWGVDYEDEFVTITSFDILEAASVRNEDIYQIERQPSVSGQVKGIMNLFRHVLPGELTLPVNDFSSIQFDIDNNLPVEVILVPKDLSDWNNRLRKVIPANAFRTSYAIPFKKFLDASGSTLTLEDIKTIVFSVKGDYQEFKNFNLNVANVGFGNSEVLTLDDVVLEKTKVINYPNPFTNVTTIKLLNATQFIDIQVVDMLGRIVDRQKINTHGNSKKVIYNSPRRLKMGVYRYLFYDDTKQKYKGSFIIY